MDRLLHTLAKVCNTLRHKDIRFAVAGGCAVYARGGPPTGHDVDIFLRPQDVRAATSALLAAGLRAAPPPEDWLTKLYDGEVLVDLIHRPNYRAVTDDLLDRAALMRVGPTSALVIGATDLMVDKLMVLDAHRLDFATLLQIARGLREQVDWPEVTARTETSPYARAFLSLVADLGITSASRTGFPDDVLPEYLEAHARRALAEDTHTAELGVHVSVVGGRLCLHGEVGSDGARSALESVLHEHLPSVPVRNQVTVTELSEPDHSETIG